MSQGQGTNLMRNTGFVNTSNCSGTVADTCSCLRCKMWTISDEYNYVVASYSSSYIIIFMCTAFWLQQQLEGAKRNKHACDKLARELQNWQWLDSWAVTAEQRWSNWSLATENCPLVTVVHAMCTSQKMVISIPVPSSYPNPNCNNHRPWAHNSVLC